MSTESEPDPSANSAAIPPSPYARRKIAPGPAGAAGSRATYYAKDSLVQPSQTSSPDTDSSEVTSNNRDARDDARSTHDMVVAQPLTAAQRRGPAPQLSAPAWTTPLEPEPMLRRRPQRPKRGWRALAYNATLGAWNPGLSPKEARMRERDAQIATQLRGKHVTAFFCLKGGISKTSTTAATSIALANLRPDPVFAIDANPDAGDLAERLTGEHRGGITALARDVDEIDSLEALSRYTATAGRLTVLPGEPNPTLGDSLGAHDFERIMNVVRRYYSFVQVDCGTGVTHPLMSGILRYADTAVIPAAWSITGAKRAAETIGWLRENGFEELARTSIVVLTAKDLVSRNVDKEAVLRHLDVAANLVIVPADPHVADGALLDWDMLQPATRDAYLEIAATITERFSGR